MEHITSRQNALMTHIRKLNASRAYRRASGEYLCDGVKLLEEALRWNAPLKTVVLSEGVDVPVLPSGVRAVQVPADVMRSISPMETPQGALFTVRLPDTALPETLTGAHYLVLDGVQDPGNVGTILRTADAFDCDGQRLRRPLQPQNGARHDGRGLSPRCVPMHGGRAVRAASKVRLAALRHGAAERHREPARCGAFPRGGRHRQRGARAERGDPFKM